MGESISGGLTERVERIRDEALALAREGESFPAVWRNAVRVLACVRIMEMDLGVVEGRGEASLPID